MNRSNEEIRRILSSFRTPDRVRYPELEDADVIYEDLVRFDVQLCLDQIEWGPTHQPSKTLFVLTVDKLG